MSKRNTRRRYAAFVAGALTVAVSAVQAQDKEVVIGLQCDRTGATQIVGTTLCPAYHDYVALVNSKGGIEGYKVKVLEIDHEYKVPPGMEAHERFKKEGAIIDSVYGTPHIAALNRKLEEDKILGTSPGFGTAAAADGKRYPYTFPIAASYWSQAGAAVAFVKEKLGDLKGKKIAYIFYDNPAGKEPLPILEDLAKSEGFELRTFAVPAPGVEMGAQVLDITGRFKPDFVIAHLFGRAPSVFIKEMKGKGYPLSKVVSLGWGSAEARAAGVAVSADDVIPRSLAAAPPTTGESSKMSSSVTSATITVMLSGPPPLSATFPLIVLLCTMTASAPFARRLCPITPWAGPEQPSAGVHPRISAAPRWTTARSPGATPRRSRSRHCSATACTCASRARTPSAARSPTGISSCTTRTRARSTPRSSTWPTPPRRSRRTTRLFPSTPPSASSTATR